MIINNFQTFDAKHCETAATKSLLIDENYDISEPMMLGLSQGFGFIYWKMSFMKLPFIGGRAKPFELTRVFCNNMGFDLEERETTSKKKAWSNISEFIDNGVPVGLQLDCYHLEHFNKSFHFAGHFVTVYGYDSTHAYIFDTGKKYRVSLENLEKARFEKGSMAENARSYTIRRGQKNLPPLEELLPKVMYEIAREFLNPPLKCFGYSGIMKLGKEIPSWLNLSSDLKDQALLMESGGTGGAIFRNFFRDFLLESQSYLPENINIKKAWELYSVAAENWSEIASLLDRAGDSREYKYLIKASEICIQTANIEKKAMELISNL